MSRVAIIPARGGSKRIPGKNIKPFFGKPMIAWSIEAAKASGLFDRIVVSTDDPAIVEVAKQYGAEVPFIRPPELADDFTPTIPVIAHAINTLKEQGDTITEACCIYATAPFIRADDLVQAHRQLHSGDWKYCFTVTEFAAPIFRSFEADENGAVSMFWPEHFETRSQDLPEALHDAGQFYFGRVEAWLEGAVFFAKHSTGYRIPRWRVQDIDTADDWTRAESMAAMLIETTSSDLAKPDTLT
jgi:pseudaminic acid cytidylyltransferase